MADILKRLAANEKTIAQQNDIITKLQAEHAQQFKTLTTTLAETATQTQESTAKMQESIAQLTAHLSAFVTSFNRDPKPGNGALQSTTRTFNSKRGAAASPSPSQSTKHAHERRRLAYALPPSPKRLERNYASGRTFPNGKRRGRT
jgi:uncharacterized coiled-coil protein SlyX